MTVAEAYVAIDQLPSEEIVGQGGHLTLRDLWRRRLDAIVLEATRALLAPGPDQRLAFMMPVDASVADTWAAFHPHGSARGIRMNDLVVAASAVMNKLTVIEADPGRQLEGLARHLPPNLNSLRVVNVQELESSLVYR